MASLMKTVEPRSTTSYFGNDIGDVGLVERRKGKALLAEMVQGSPYMDQRRAVDYQETVMELASIMIPYSVNALIGTDEYFMRLNRSQFVTSSLISPTCNANMNSAGNRSMFRFTA